MKRTLLADIGGTYARFAMLSGDKLASVMTLSVNDHRQISDAIRHFLAKQGGASSIDEAILALAGPIGSGRCALTNSAWVVDGEALKHEFGFRTLRLVNDHEAAAWSLPHLAPSDTLLIGPDKGAPDAPMALLGPGTGLGMACYVQSPGGKSVVASEGGHMTLAATSDYESDVIAILRRQFAHVSAERVLSGPGLLNLYRAIATLDGVEVLPRAPAEVTRAALDGTCATCRKTLDTFVSFLGSVAGDVALLFGARGGVFVGGGIIPHIAHRLPAMDFRQRFEAKGKFQAYLSEIPLRIVLRRDAAFLGLTALVRNAAAKPCGGDYG
jgi:glucokinase